VEKVGEIGSGGSGSRIMNDIDFFFLVTIL
jgi:hypothetical protein